MSARLGTDFAYYIQNRLVWLALKANIAIKTGNAQKVHNNQGQDWW
jgi:hypothetical protein